MIGLLAQWRALIAATAGAGLIGLFALWRLEAGHVRQLKSQVEAAQALQKNAQAQAAAAGDAEAVIADGAARDQRTSNQHAENSHDIQTAPGSGQSLDLGLNAAGRRGLCSYQSYSTDPACLQLRGADPGQRPPAGGADAPAGD